MTINENVIKILSDVVRDKFLDGWESEFEKICHNFIEKEKVESEKLELFDNDNIVTTNIGKQISEAYLKNENTNIDDPKNINDHPGVDVVLICALPEEQTEALKVFDVEKDYTEEYCFEGRFYFQSFKYQAYNMVAVNQPKMGSAMAASLTTRSIMCFSPKLVVMTGICAGRSGKTKIGDILLASSVYDYTAGKITKTGNLVRPDPIQCDNDILNIYTQKTENRKDFRVNRELKSMWYDDKRPSMHSEVHIKALGTGSSVIADGKIIEEAIRTQDDLYGIDMEGYGVAVAASQLKIPFFIVKGIQDFANHEKNSTEAINNAREFACFSSAVLASILIPEVLKLV